MRKKNDDDLYGTLNAGGLIGVILAVGALAAFLFVPIFCRREVGLLDVLIGCAVVLAVGACVVIEEMIRRGRRR